MQGIISQKRVPSYNVSIMETNSAPPTRSPWPSYRLSLLSGLIVFVISAGLGLATILTPYDSFGRAFQFVPQAATWLRLLGAIAAFVLPLGIEITLRQRKDYRMMAASEHWNALIGRTARPMMVVIAVLVGIMPLLLATSYAEAKQYAESGCFAFATQEELAANWDDSAGFHTPANLQCVLPTDPRLLSTSLLHLLWGVGWLGVVVLSAAAGVWVASFQRVIEALALIVFVGIVIVGAVTILGPVIGLYLQRDLPGRIVSCYETCYVTEVWPPILNPRLIFAFVPFLLAAGLAGWARSNVAQVERSQGQQE